MTDALKKFRRKGLTPAVKISSVDYGDASLPINSTDRLIVLTPESGDPITINGPVANKIAPYPGGYYLMIDGMPAFMGAEAFESTYEPV